MNTILLLRSEKRKLTLCLYVSSLCFYFRLSLTFLLLAKKDSMMLFFCLVLTCVCVCVCVCVFMCVCARVCV